MIQWRHRGCHVVRPACRHVTSDTNRSGQSFLARERASESQAAGLLASCLRRSPSPHLRGNHDKTVAKKLWRSIVSECSFSRVSRVSRARDHFPNLLVPSSSLSPSFLKNLSDHSLLYIGLVLLASRVELGRDEVDTLKALSMRLAIAAFFQAFLSLSSPLFFPGCSVASADPLKFVFIAFEFFFQGREIKIFWIVYPIPFLTKFF